MNPPTHLDPSHATTSYSAGQMIQFARAVGLEVFLASYGMLEDLLLKARVAGGDQIVGSRHSVGKSPFLSVAVEGSLQEPCSSKQADARLAAGHVSGEKPVNDSLKTL